jgi:outer membrane protein TolC
MTRVQSRRVRGLGSGVVLFLLALGTAHAQQPSVPALLTLEEAISLALQGSTRIGIRAEQLEAARKAKTNAWLDLGPDLQLSASTSALTRTDFDVQLDQVAPVDSVVDQVEESSSRQGQASSSIRLFDGLANYSRISAAKHDVRAGEYGLEYSRTLVEEAVIAAYYNLLRAQLLRGVAQDGERVAREQLQRTQALYDLGSAARSDVLKSQVQLGNTRLTLVRANNGERQAKLDLEHAMNLDTSVPFAIDTTVVDTQIELPVFETERSFGLTHRTDLMALREVELASDRRVRVARGPLFPSLDFRYSVSLTDADSEFRFGAQRNRTRSWALFANWNIWDRYQVYSNIGQARSGARIAAYDRRQAELDAAREIRTYVNNIEEAAERLTVSRENVVRSQEDLRLAQEKFRVGAGTILDTITAESDLTLTRANEVTAIVDYLIGRANLARATGNSITRQ